MEKEKLDAIIEAHKHWLNEDCKNWQEMRADLCYADLRDADLRDADLRDANLCGADLCGANLCYADLCYADLRYADLRYADLRYADLRDADLCGANLRDADLRYADLRDANLCDADLRDADLCDANLCGAKDVPYIPMVCPEEGGFFGYKKCAKNKIVKLFIPKDAKRSSATGRKCRCSKAFVCEIIDSFGNKCDLAVSDYDEDFVYKLHEWVESEFCEDRFNERAEGIHFFIQRKEAERYQISTFLRIKK